MNTSYTYTTTSTNLTPDQQAAVFALTGVFLLVAIIFAVVLYVYSAITLSKIFKKAGIQSWIAWVPYYNTWKVFEMGNMHPALSLLTYAAVIPFIGTIVAIAGWVLYIIVANNIGKGFGKKGPFTLLFVFLPVIWLGILAFGKDKWSGKMYKKATPAPAAPTPPSAA